MDFLLAIFGTLLITASVFADKYIISRLKVPYQTQLTYSWPMYFLANIVLFVVLGSDMPIDQAHFSTAWMLLLSCVMSMVTGYLYYRALSKDKLTEVESIDVLQGAPIILFSALVFARERNLAVIALACVAIGSMAWSHWSKRHFKVAKRSWQYLLACVAIVPIESIVIRGALDVWSAPSMQVIRSGVMALFYGILLARHYKGIPLKAIFMILLSSMLAAGGWLVYYMSYKNLGIVYTTLTFCLQPLLVYIIALLFFKEKLHYRKALAFVVTVLSISLAQTLVG